jgi:anthranilate/para-aminobenzoate synthase component I
MSAAAKKCQSILSRQWAGIVAGSNPAAEYEETLAKAAGFLAALNCSSRREEAHFKIGNGKLI